MPEPGEEAVEVTAVVTHLLPEFGQVEIETGEGWCYAISRHTQGVRIADLREGQRLVCQVTRHLPRVLHARTLG
jgi:hypothetical protein